MKLLAWEMLDGFTFVTRITGIFPARPGGAIVVVLAELSYALLGGTLIAIACLRAILFDFDVVIVVVDEVAAGIWILFHPFAVLGGVVVVPIETVIGAFICTAIAIGSGTGTGSSSCKS